VSDRLHAPAVLPLIPLDRRLGGPRVSQDNVEEKIFDPTGT
jgi:hypothetical protein